MLTQYAVLTLISLGMLLLVAMALWTYRLSKRVVGLPEEKEFRSSAYCYLGAAIFIGGGCILYWARAYELMPRSSWQEVALVSNVLGLICVFIGFSSQPNHPDGSDPPRAVPRLPLGPARRTLDEATERRIYSEYLAACDRALLSDAADLISIGRTQGPAPMATAASAAATRAMEVVAWANNLELALVSEAIEKGTLNKWH